ncbi:hypothetical protein [Methanohalobium sp.]|uniref:hypothetical protein n=1 Tax=Methanohalobium sp. TaxID=2837493 RepID=UPI0025D1EF60|nr:hypothetical protein [Methanohalobium sp.]
MNALEMQFEIEKRIGQLDNITPMRITTHEIESYLNYSQDIELKDIYSRVVGSTQTKFESTEKIRREIGNLITSFTTTDFDDTSEELHKNGVFVTLPGNYLYGIEEKCLVNGEITKVTPKTHDEYLENIENPFLYPNEDLVWRLDFGFTGATGAKKHELIHREDDEISEYTVRYIRRPQNIVLHPTDSQDCELDESTHENIVNRVVSLAGRKYKEEEK